MFFLNIIQIQLIQIFQDWLRRLLFALPEYQLTSFLFVKPHDIFKGIYIVIKNHLQNRFFQINILIGVLGTIDGWRAQTLLEIRFAILMWFVLMCWPLLSGGYFYFRCFLILTKVQFFQVLDFIIPTRGYKTIRFCDLLYHFINIKLNIDIILAHIYISFTSSRAGSGNHDRFRLLLFFKLSCYLIG